jgi:uridine kinase
MYHLFMVNIKLTRRDDKAAPREYVCAAGATALALLEAEKIPFEGVIAVKVNNIVQSLGASLDTNARLEFITMEDHEGRAIYRRSLAFLLAAAAKDCFPKRSIYIGHSLGNGYFYHFKDEKTPTAAELSALEEKIRLFVAEALPINFRYLAWEEALDFFRASGQDDTALLLEERTFPKIGVDELCRFQNASGADIRPDGTGANGASAVCSACNASTVIFTDLNIEPLVHNTRLLSNFEIRPYGDGFLLRYPSASLGSGPCGSLGEFTDSPKIFAVYKEYKKWGGIVGVRSAGELNRVIAQGKIKDFVRTAEGFHAKKLSQAADVLFERRDEVKVLLIAGPSSSGKTTTAKRMAVQLQILGLEPVLISLDDYYRHPDEAPKDENGRPDLECLEALDLPFINEQLSSLLKGDEVRLPVFDFVTGGRKEGRAIKMGPRSILVLEGIHGLNEELTSSIHQKNKFKLYVSPLTQLNLDDHNRVPTSDNRLIRRIVRDYHFRGASAAKTLGMWPSVRKGELKHIFPYQNLADHIFNSALDYELSVLRFYAEPVLRRVRPTESSASEAVRLLSFLKNFTPVMPALVPGESILREFIGDSDFKY